MARVVSNSILGCRISGAIGDKFFYVRNGKQYMRLKGEKVSRTKTAAQLDHGAKFKLVIEFLKPLKEFIREGFKSKSALMSPFNAAMSYSLHHSITGTYPEYQIDYPNVLVSKGPISMASNPTVNSNAEGQIEFKWDDNPFGYEANGDDKAMLLVYNPSKQEAVSVLRGNNRISESQIITLPKNFKDDEVHCWMAFVNARYSKVSDSRYVGSVVVK